MPAQGVGLGCGRSQGSGIGFVCEEGGEAWAWKPVAAVWKSFQELRVAYSRALRLPTPFPVADRGVLGCWKLEHDMMMT